MANRFWVGGTDAWNATAGTKWSATNGGAGGATVPTAADDVFFTSLSGVGTVTVSATANCLTLNCTGFTGTLAGTSAIQAAGNVTLATGMGYTHSGGFSFNISSNPATLTTAGKMVGQVTIGTATFLPVVTLGDALFSNSTITLTRGTLTTNNFNLTADVLSSNNSNVRTINLGSSTVTLSGITPLTFATNANLTFNAGTSTLVFTTNIASPNFGDYPTAGPITAHNLSFTSTLPQTKTLTYNRLTINSLSLVGGASVSATPATIQLTGVLTVNSGFNTSSTSGTRPVLFTSAFVSPTNSPPTTVSVIMNGTGSSLTDALFRYVQVSGAGAPLTGTRVGVGPGCVGIAGSAPKTVYWVTTAGASWLDNNFSDTNGGAPSTDFFPLPQDTVVVTNTAPALNNSISFNIGDRFIIGSLDMSARTAAMSISSSNSPWFFGNVTLGTGVSAPSFTPSAAIFCSDGAQSIRTAGVTLPAVFNVLGTLNMLDAFTGGSLFVRNGGTLNTNGFALSVATLSTGNAGTTNLSSSAVSITSSFTNAQRVGAGALNAGTSTITMGPTALFSATIPTFSVFNLIFSVPTTATTLPTGLVVTGTLTLTAPPTPGLASYFIANGGTVTAATLATASASPTQRVMLRSALPTGVLFGGGAATLSATSITGTDIDFSNITVTGAASGASVTRAGNMGNNSGITFPSPKTVYWNLAGTANWTDTGWATSSGGTPAVNNFPLAQDTAVFDNAGSAGTVTINAVYNIGAVSMSSRSSAMTLAVSAGARVLGDWAFGSGVTTSAGTTALNFSPITANRTLTCNGVTFNFPVTVQAAQNFDVRLGSAFLLASDRALTLSSGIFDARTFTVTLGSFVSTGTNFMRLKMGSALWTVTGTGTVWNTTASRNNFSVDKGTADVLLSDNTTTARTMTCGGSFSGGVFFNKVTIGGTTSTSTTTLQFLHCIELASTKTVAHTVTLAGGGSAPQIGKWSITGTSGNLVTVTNTSGSLIDLRQATTGVNFLTLGTVGFAGAEMFAGPNSTGTGSRVFLIARPTPRTLYWVGGTGATTDTTKWALSSGGAGGNTIPYTIDTAIFNSASSAASYTVTISGSSPNFDISGPASGNISFSASNVNMFGNLTFAATGGILMGGFGSSNVNFDGGPDNSFTITTNGRTLPASVFFRGAGCTHTLGSALTASGSLTLNSGTVTTNNFNITATTTNANVIYETTATLNLGSSTFTLTDATNDAVTFNRSSDALKINAGTSTIVINGTGSLGRYGEHTYGTLSFVSTNTGSRAVRNETRTWCAPGSPTFANISFVSPASDGVISPSFDSLTITSTLTLGTASVPTRRLRLRSSVTGTISTLSIGAITPTAASADFQELTITGAAAGTSMTGSGNIGNSTGLTFATPKTVYWNLAGVNSWTAAGWATSSGGTPAAANFPLPQDTAVFDNAGAATSVTEPTGFYVIGTVNASARTSAMTLAIGGIAFRDAVILGSGITTATAASTLQILPATSASVSTINTNGVTINCPISVNGSISGGTVRLLGALTVTNTVSSSLSGTFDTNGFAVSATRLSLSNTSVLTLGSSALTLTGSSPWSGGPSVTANTAVVTLTNASGTTSVAADTTSVGVMPRFIVAGGTNASDVTFTGSARYAGLSTTRTVAFGISFPNSTVNSFDQFTLAGTVSALVTLKSNTISSGSAILAYTGPDTVDTNFLVLEGMALTPRNLEWYVGTGSVIGYGGEDGAIFTAFPVPSLVAGQFFLMFY